MILKIEPLRFLKDLVFLIIPNINILVAMLVAVGCNMPGVGFILMLIVTPFILLCIMN